MKRNGFDATDAATVRLVEKVVCGPHSVGWKMTD